MLGCQDFCGYYDWTFHFISRTFGHEAVRNLWAEAIGGDSQTHYLEAGRKDGLRGLHRVWMATGEDEHCDWTFTLDETRNLLRWDMRHCPSKGFLLENDLNAHEDYCDHCMGWMVPLLAEVGVEVITHEHNHCGQCWGEMKVRDRPYESLPVDCDIRRDPRWQRGYVERWEHGVKLPVLRQAGDSSDPCDVIAQWFSKADQLVIWCPQDTTGPSPRGDHKATSVVMTDADYVSPAAAGTAPLAVMLSPTPTHLISLAKRFDQTEPVKRPLLMHAYLPGVPSLPFAAFGIPRPVPILPWLIRQGQYCHRPGGPRPSTQDFLQMLVASFRKPRPITQRCDHAKRQHSG